MDQLFQFGTDPWGREIIIRLAWGLLTLSFWAGIGFVVFHAVYAVVWKPRVEPGEGEKAAPAAAEAHADIPEKIVRHTGPARMFHWVMAASMLALLVTGFFPIVGLEFSWLTIHWVSGLILILCILYHIVHASFFLDFWSIWILPQDLKEAVRRTQRQLGATVDIDKHGKYPLDHKLYHLAVSIFGLVVSVSGLLMMLRIDNPILSRNDFLFEGAAMGNDAAWGVVYVLHGLSAVLFVMLTITHIYFAVRPEKLWITKSMVFGTVTRDDYLAHHSPKRWDVTPPKPPAKPPAPAPAAPAASAPPSASPPPPASPPSPAAPAASASPPASPPPSSAPAASAAPPASPPSPAAPPSTGEPASSSS